MTPRLTEAKYVREYMLHLRFGNGTEGDVDISQELEGEVFDRLKDRDFFQAFTISPELHTVVWPNGADFAPEFLYEKVQILA
jgi:hypothetical protein